MKGVRNSMVLSEVRIDIAVQCSSKSLNKVKSIGARRFSWSTHFL